MVDSTYPEDEEFLLDGDAGVSEWSGESLDAEKARQINSADSGAVSLQNENAYYGEWDGEEYALDISDEEVDIAESSLEGMDTIQMGFGSATFDTGIEVDPSTMAKLVGAGESMVSGLQGLEQLAEDYTPIDQLFGFGKEEMERNSRHVRALSASEEYGTDVTIGQIGGYLVEPLGFLIPGGKAASVMKSMGKGAITAGSLGFVDYVDDEAGESRIFNTGAGIALGGALGYGIGKLMSETLPKPLIEVAPPSKHVGVNPNATQFAEDMDTLEELIAREINIGASTEQAIKIVQETHPEAFVKGMDAKKAMSSTLDIEAAKANLPLADEAARTGDPLDMIDLDYLGKHRAHNGVEQTILSIDERFRNLSPRMYKKLMDFETFLKVQPQKLKAMRETFASYFETHTRRTIGTPPKEGVFSEAEVNKIKFFTINGRFDEADEFIRIAKGDAAVKAFRQATEVYKTKGQELFDAGIIDKLEDNYWARVVLPDQREDFLDALQEYLETKGRAGKTKVNTEVKDSLAKYNTNIEKVKKKLAKKNQILSEYEESKLFAQWFMRDSSHITKNSGIKRRGLKEVPEELAKYYADPIQSMDSWIHRMTKEEANMNFLGKDGYKAGSTAIKEVGVFNNTEAVDAFSNSKFTSEILAEMDGDARRELLDLMKLRLGDGLATPSQATRTYKGVVNSTLLGNPFSAFIQLGDIPRAAYNYGIKSAGKGLLKAIKKETGSKLTIEEMGLTRMAQEFEDVGDDMLIGRIQDTLFTYSGFARADKLGKETILNAALDSFADAVKDPSSRAFQKFRRKYEPTWGVDDFKALVGDLQGYNAGGQVKEGVSDNIQAMLITELSQAQPINVSSQTSYAAKSDFWKVFMTLKSFTLRQVNTVYRDIYKEASQAARKGDAKAAARATTNLVKYVAYVGGGNLAVSEARDIISGKKTFEDLIPTDAGDALVYAITSPALYGLKMFNIDGYAMDKLARSGTIGGTLDVFAPPVPVVDDALRLMNKQNVTGGDVADAVVKNIPYAGRIIKAFQAHSENIGNSGVAQFAEGGLVQSFQHGGGVHKDTQINHAFITELEDAERTLVGYIPKDKDGKILGESGVTVGGLDLGQWTEEELEKYGMPQEYIDKYKPYLSPLRKEAAAKKLKKMPLTIDGTPGGEYDIVTEFSHRAVTDKVVNLWRTTTAISDKMPIKEFSDLQPHQQTLVASIAYQFGENGSPKFTQAAMEGRWEDAVAEVKAFDGVGIDSEFQPRRNSEVEEYKRVESSLHMPTQPAAVQQSKDSAFHAEKVSSVGVEMERDPKNPGTAKPTAVKDRSDKMPQFMDRIMNPSKYPQILNDDGSVSSHLMSAEMDEDGVSYAFPMIVSMPDGRLKQFKDPQEALTYNKSIGNVFEAASIEDAVKFTETYKQLNPEMEKGILAGGPLQTEEYKEKTLSFAKGGPVTKNWAGVYEDEEGNRFRVAKDGELKEMK